MIITGTICVCDGESIIDCKRYVDKLNREDIIRNWSFIKYDSLIIIPDNIEIPTSGFVSLKTNKIRCKSYYHTLEERQKIIDDWIDLYNLNDKEYTLNIIPND